MRTLIVLVLVIGAGLGWIVRSARIQREAVAAIHNAGGYVDYNDNDIEWGGRSWGWNTLASSRDVIGEHIGIDYVLRAVDVNLNLGGNRADCQQAIARLPHLCQLRRLSLMGESVTDGILTQLHGLTRLEDVALQNTGISNSGLAHLREITNLQSIFISNSSIGANGSIFITNGRIGDDGLSHFRGLTKLKHLTLWHIGVTDAGMERVKELVSLQELCLGETRVSDVGLRHLGGLSNLNTLSLIGTKVTGALGWSTPQTTDQTRRS